jgi:ABC-type uncharacterized transport system ATPase subunit
LGGVAPKELRRWPVPTSSLDGRITMYDDQAHLAELAAVLHVLSAPTVWRRAEPYVGRDAIDWAGLRAEAQTMSGGEQVLVRIADELWHAEKVTGLWELTRRLDAKSFERVVEALRLARGITRRRRSRAALAA